MRKYIARMIILGLVGSFATDVMAKSERKEVPKRRFVEEVLEAAGLAHFPAKMGVKKISSIEVGDTYYHIYEGELDKIDFHIIVFDNYKNYLGYYKSAYPPTNYQIKGSIVVDSGDVDEDDEPLYYSIPISLTKGLPSRVQIGGMPTSLVKAPQAATAPTKAKNADGPVPEYREWTIMHKGKKIPARAIYVKQASGKVVLKLEANGVEKGFLLNSLSREDQAYVKQFK